MLAAVEAVDRTGHADHEDVLELFYVEPDPPNLRNSPANMHRTLFCPSCDGIGGLAKWSSNESGLPVRRFTLSCW